MRGIKSDGVVVMYDSHSFLGGPEPYIRLGKGNLTVSEAHENIEHTLVNVFANSRSTSDLINKDIKKTQGFISLNFINYGDMQLVYLATLSDSKKVAVSINQPHTPLGYVKKEFYNLERLVEIDKRFVVKPIKYFSMADLGHELYISEYFPDAMCVAHNNVKGNPHGMYNPLPSYHFENFSKNISSVINFNIIALLVNYYDAKRGRGLAKTQISGNDFILTRDFRKDDIRTIPHSLKLIAARGFVNASLKEYCNMLRHEFLIGTNRNDADVVSGKIKINHKSKVPMTEKEIDIGIALGLTLRS